jgi:hypothetical protein
MLAARNARGEKLGFDRMASLTSQPAAGIARRETLGTGRRYNGSDAEFCSGGVNLKPQAVEGLPPQDL